MAGRTRFEPLGADDLPGVAGYPFRARIGTGDGSRVYLSFTPDGRPVAVRVVRPDRAADPEFRRRLTLDVGVARNVVSPYVAPVVDADPSAEVPWLATAYVPGPSLAEAVQLRGPLPEGIAFGLLAGVAEGLKAIRAAGLIHRQLNAANVLLVADGPRLVDVGLNLLTEATVGPAFLAPEQMHGGDVSSAADLFALGGLVYFAATGRTAFGDGPDTPRRITDEAPDLSGCPERLRTIIQRCLEKAPGARPSLDEVLAYARDPNTGMPAGDPGSWLPESVIATFAEYDVASVPGLAPPPAQLWPAPGAPQAPSSPWPPPAFAIPPTAAARSRANGRGAVVIAVVAVLVVAAATFAITKPWQTTKSDLSGKMLNAPAASAKRTPAPSSTGPTATSSTPAPIVLPPPPAPIVVPTTSLSPTYDYLDDASTDTTPQTVDAMLPSTFTDSEGRKYTLEGSAAEACVNQYESSTAQNVLSSNNCSSDITGSYVYDGGSILVSVSVLTFPDAATATSVESQLANSTNTGDLGWHCPDSGNGSSVCADGVSSGALQDGWVSNFHRYVLSADAIFIDQATSSKQEDTLKSGSRGAVDVIGPANFYQSF